MSHTCQSLLAFCDTASDSCWDLLVILVRSPKVQLGAAEGGNGGHGGAVVFTASISVKSLAAVRTHYHAGKGGRGQGALKSGKRGTDVVIKVSL